MKIFNDNLKRALRYFWHNKYRVICVFLIAAIVFGTLNYFKNSNKYSATMSLNYSEAANGLNPNNTRFNSYEFLSHSILESAISTCGLQNTVTADELERCVTVSPVDTGNVSGDEGYICTTYRITLDVSDIDTKNIDKGDLMKALCYSYKDFFLSSYGDNQSILQKRLESEDDYEPYIRIKEIENEVASVYRYLSARVEENKTYTDPETGIGFVQLEKSLNNIMSYDIPNVMAFIIEEGVTRDENTLLQIMEYKNKIEQMLSDKSLEHYKADRGGIEMYDTAMSSVVMIPTTDNTEEYYMSRTKTAMDYMAESSDLEADDVAAYNKDILSTDYVIECIKKSTGGKDDLENAVEMTEELERLINGVTEDLLKVDASYIEYKSKNYISYIFSSMSVMSKIDVKKTLVESAAVLAVWYFALALIYLRREINNEEV